MLVALLTLIACEEAAVEATASPTPIVHLARVVCGSSQEVEVPLAGAWDTSDPTAAPMLFATLCRGDNVCSSAGFYIREEVVGLPCDPTEAPPSRWDIYGTPGLLEVTGSADSGDSGGPGATGTGGD